MNNYTFKHLTDTDRVRIEVLLKEGFKPIDIAEKLGVNRSTICREMKIRGTPSGYHAKIAQINYNVRRQKCRPKRIIEETVLGSHVISKIRAGWSPETISGRLKLEIELGTRTENEFVNPESIYQFIYESDFGKHEKLYEYLRRGKKHRSKKHGRKAQKSIIPNRVFIESRPKEIDKRKAVGHWEGDTIHYPEKRGINSLVERKTRYAILTKLERRTAEMTTRAVIGGLKNHYSESLTVDNGTENIEHELIAQALDLSIFFCHAYHSWEKGSNENLNGLVRKYLPRGTDLSQISQNDLDDIAFELNNRPRKILGFYTPQETLKFEYTKLINVAFRT
jgi:IS30 family transposase